MTKYTTKKAAELADRLANQKAENDCRMAAIEAEQAAHEEKLAAALDTAGPARVALVEDLLEQFAIDPVEHEKRRNKRTGEVITGKDGQPVMVNPDPDETLRLERLAQAITAATAAVRTAPTPSPGARLAPVGDTRNQATATA